MSKKVKIAHSLEELEDDVILTLIDKPILQDGRLDIDQDDVLQNEEIQLSNEAKHNAELKSKMKNISDAASSHLEAKNQGASGLLPHYNDYSFKPSTIDVEEGNVIRTKKFKKIKGVGSDYIENDATTTVKLNSQYTTKKEGKKGKASSKDLLNFLDETAEDNLISMKKQQENLDIIKESMEQIKKKRILENSIKNIVQYESFDDEEETFLLKSIERSRKKMEANNKPLFNVLNAIKEEPEDPEHDKNTVEIELNPISYQSSEAVRKDRKVQLKQAMGGTSSVMFAQLPSQKLAQKSAEVDEVPMKFQDFSKEQMQKMRKQVQFLQDKEVGIGLAGTLAYLRQNSLMGQEEQVGRHNDKSVSYNDPNDPSDRIKLEYRNASGKLMKPKEAYRYICAKFHGEGPSKNKVQIRKRRQLQDLRVKQQANEGGQLLKMLESHQSQSGEAHMLINLGNKGGKQ